MFPRLLIFALVFCALPPVLADAGQDFFEQKVRPLLAERCLKCHSAEHKIKGGLRLDLRDGWVHGGDSGPAIVAGDVTQSKLIEAIRYANLDLQMPPDQQLATAEIALLEQWVKMGAPDPRTEGTVGKKQTGLSLAAGKKFWAYTPVTTQQAPEVRNSAWPLGNIDRFILAKLEAAALTPAPPVTPEALCRRLYYTLIGLPPSVAQLDKFIAAAAANRTEATTALVDELLASNHFGETWGRHWLDVARFAESSGGGRTLLFKDAWRYRDYVIESFNADVPYDQFLHEQIAGDLLPAASQADHRRHLIATAFLTLGPTNYEEQDKQQLRFDVIDEQIDTLGKALLGQTIGCARCHDHKFDPIPQQDYYALAGIFASTRTLMSYTENVARWISEPLPEEPAQEALLVAHESSLADLQKRLSAAKKTLQALPPSDASVLPTKAFPGIVLDDTEAKVVGDWKRSTHVKRYLGEGYLSDDNLAKGERTVTFTPPIPRTTSYEVRLAYTHSVGRAKAVRINILHADGEDTVTIDQSVEPPIEGRFVSLGKYRFEKEGAGYVLISNAGTDGFVIVDALQLLATDGVGIAVASAAESSPPATQSAKQVVKSLEAELKQLTEHGPVRPTTMAVHDESPITDTQIRVRGIEKQRGAVVPRGFLQVATNSSVALPTKESGRRELAQWMTSEEHPLTARVMVNRLWAWLFGAGLVRTVDNFGTTGEAPSHPELLDYLAQRFMRGGWKMKPLIREMVLSRTWQQSISPATAQDSEQRLWGHALRRRLDAEQLRDTFLRRCKLINITKPC